MTYLQIIASAAKTAKVSAVLLYAICAHESRDYTLDFALYDNGSPSFGVCQLKKDTALQLGWSGKDEMELRNPYLNVKLAAAYLKYEQDRYGEDWVKITSAYNSGSYSEGKVKGCPKNLKYLNLVKAKLPENLRYKLECRKEQQ